MDVVSSAAAITQIIGQAIFLLQELYKAREAVRTAPKTLKDTRAHLSNLVSTVEEVHREESLHTAAIYAELQVIYNIVIELNQILKAMEELQRKNKMYQGVYALIKSQRDEGRLVDVMRRLGAAKAELAIRIDVAHVSMTKVVAEGVGRIEQGVHTMVQKESENERHRYQIDENAVFDDSDQLNGIVGMENLSLSTTASIRGNASMGNGRQRNLILAGPASSKFL